MMTEVILVKDVSHHAGGFDYILGGYYGWRKNYTID
jgi:hypothetical protein